MEIFNDFKIGALQGISAVIVLGAVGITLLVILIVVLVNAVKAIKERKDAKEDARENQFYAQYGITGDEMRLNERLAAKRAELAARKGVPYVAPVVVTRAAEPAKATAKEETKAKNVKKVDEDDELVSLQPLDQMGGGMGMYPGMYPMGGFMPPYMPYNPYMSPYAPYIPPQQPRPEPDEIYTLPELVERDEVYTLPEFVEPGATFSAISNERPDRSDDIRSLLEANKKPEPVVEEKPVKKDDEIVTLDDVAAAADVDYTPVYGRPDRHDDIEVLMNANRHPVEEPVEEPVVELDDRIHIIETERPDRTDDIMRVIDANKKPEPVVEEPIVELDEKHYVEPTERPDRSSDIYSLTEALKEPEPEEPIVELDEKGYVEPTERPDRSSDIYSLTEALKEPEPEEPVVELDEKGYVEPSERPDRSGDIYSLTEAVKEPEPVVEDPVVELDERYVDQSARPDRTDDIRSLTDAVKEPEPVKEEEPVVELDENGRVVDNTYPDRMGDIAVLMHNGEPVVEEEVAEEEHVEEPVAEPVDDTENEIVELEDIDEEPVEEPVEEQPAEEIPEEQPEEEPVEEEPAEEEPTEEEQPEEPAEEQPAEEEQPEETPEEESAKPEGLNLRREENWANYDGDFEGYYYDPADGCYYEGEPSDELKDILAAKKAAFEDANGAKGGKFAIKKVMPSFMPLSTPKNERKAPEKPQGFDDSSIYGKYVIEHVAAADGAKEYFFTLYDPKGDTLYESLNFSTLDNCKKGINRFKVHVQSGTLTVVGEDGKFLYQLVTQHFTYKGVPKASFEDADAMIERVKDCYATPITREQ